MSLCVCPICNSEYRNLTKHVNMAHKISKEELLNKYPGTKTISEETSKAISESLENNWKDPEYADKCSSYWRSAEHGKEVSERLIKVWKEDPDKYKIPFTEHARSDEGRATRRNTMKCVVTKLWEDPEYYARRQEAGRIQMEKNLQDPKFGCWGRRENYLYEGIYYRSSWEVNLVKFLEALQIKFSYETFRFDYEYQGSTHKYIPDFYLDDYDLFLEVKPECRIDEVTDLKLEAVRSSGYKIYYHTDCSEEGLNSQLVPLLSNE